MKINFDVSGLNGNELTGIGTYTKNLINTLSNDSTLDLTGSYRISRIKNRKEIFKNTELPNIYPLLPYLNNKYDIFHGPDFWVPSLGKFKKIVTLHDLTFYHEDLYNPNLAKYFQAKIEKMLFKAKPDHIIVVSDFIKNEFLERFPVFRNCVTRIYHGADHFNQLENHKRVFDFPYIVNVGVVVKRKNILSIFHSFKIVSKKMPDLRLVICGATNNEEGIAIRNEIENSAISEKIIFTSYLPKEKLQNIISNAEAMIFPSLYEGFGFTILEAMMLKTPVIASNLGVMKEIGLDSVLLVNTKNIEEIAESILYLLNNSTLKEELILKGSLRANEFTWQKCANETKQIYQNILLK